MYCWITTAKKILPGVKFPAHRHPIYTYDTWSISGEGTGGMFRPYRSDIGYVYDHKMSTKSINRNIGTDLGFGSILKAGVDITR